MHWGADAPSPRCSPRGEARPLTTRGECSRPVDPGSDSAPAAITPGLNGHEQAPSGVNGGGSKPVEALELHDGRPVTAGDRIERVAVANAVIPGADVAVPFGGDRA